LYSVDEYFDIQNTVINLYMI